MMSKTPNFDSKMMAILDKTIPGSRICKESGETFEIRPEDLDFYKMMLVPAPKVAPWVRQRDLYANTPSDELFKRKSDLSGKDIVANIEPGSPLPVYDDIEWWSDKWDAATYGVAYDPTKNFLEQWYDLKMRVPRPAKAQFSPEMNVNSEWAIEGYQMKNCYYTYGGVENENLCYAVSSLKSRDSLELWMSDHCELSYDLFDSKTCYKSAFLDTCENCINCYFGFDLKDCENCFGCFNLRHKKHCFFNKQMTPEEYEAKIRTINLGSRKEVKLLSDKFEEILRQRAVRLHLETKSAENSFGDDLVECQNCYYCFNVYQSKNAAYVFRAFNIQNSQDIYGDVASENSIGSFGTKMYNAKYCPEVDNSQNVEYCCFCFNLENCFGCVGLRNKKFCILNRQYTESEYWVLVDNIKCAMLEQGEYGQIGPAKYSLFPFNLSPAQKIFPLTKEEVLQRGARWYTAPTAALADGTESSALPDDIKDVTTDIIGKPIICPESKRLFTIIKQEFEFYKKMNLPLPRVHPMTRRARQWQKIRLPKLVKGSCSHCHKEIWIRGLSPETQRIKDVCHDCYLKVLNSPPVK